MGRSLADDLIPVTAEDTQLGLKLNGLTAKPGIGRSTRRELVTLVNRRPVDSRLFSYAVFDAYHGRIQKGRYPPAFLFLSMPSDAVDVNVHPAKREVRFRHEANIRRFILSAINSHLNDFSAQSVADLHSSTPAKPAVERAPTVQVSAKPSASPPPAHVQEVPSVAPAPKSKPKSIPKASGAGRPQATPAPQPTVTPSPISQVKKSAQVNSKPLPSAEPVDIGWEFIHCFQKRYALYATPRGLVMIYLRHADQRIQFELIGQNYNERTVAAQQLLVPHPMELDPQRHATGTTSRAVPAPRLRYRGLRQKLLPTERDSRLAQRGPSRAVCSRLNRPTTYQWDRQSQPATQLANRR